VISAEIEPTTRFAIGATATRYLSTSAFVSASTRAGFSTNGPVGDVRR
jgi:hypothetical protein